MREVEIHFAFLCHLTIDLYYYNKKQLKLKSIFSQEFAIGILIGSFSHSLQKLFIDIS